MKIESIGAALSMMGAAIMAAIAGLAIAVAIHSCAAFQPQFHLVEPELVDDPKFGSCARTGTTLQASETQFALLTSVCVQRLGDAGVVIDPPVEPAIVKDASAQLAQDTDQ